MRFAGACAVEAQGVGGDAHFARRCDQEKAAPLFFLLGRPMGANARA